VRSIVDVVRPARLWHGRVQRRYQSLLCGDGDRTVVDDLAKNGDPIDHNMVVVNLANLGIHRLTSVASRRRHRVLLDHPNCCWLTSIGDGARLEAPTSKPPQG
jgi:hypothetical protein